MKQATIDKIVNNHNINKPTYIGKYTYKLAYHSMANKWYIIRCPRGKEDVEFLIPVLFNGDIPTVTTYWEWYLPIDF